MTMTMTTTTMIGMLAMATVMMVTLLQGAEAYHLTRTPVNPAVSLRPSSGMRLMDSKSNKNAATTSSADQAARQLMGIKGAAETKNKWAIRLQLCKPVTWIPLIWGVACGAAASGNYHTLNPFDINGTPLSLVGEDALKAAACMVLSGPLLTGYTQVSDPLVFRHKKSRYRWILSV